jgi:serine/threonine-protein kinase SRPK3
VALKLLRSDCYGTEHDIFEIEILETIARHKKDANSAHLVELLDTFQVNGATGVHQCIAMPVLGCSVSAQAGRFPNGRIPHRIVKQITKQLLSGLAFLHDTCGVIHTGRRLPSVL